MDRGMRVMGTSSPLHPAIFLFAKGSTYWWKKYIIGSLSLSFDLRNFLHKNCFDIFQDLKHGTMLQENNLINAIFFKDTVVH